MRMTTGSTRLVVFALSGFVAVLTVLTRGCPEPIRLASAPPLPVSVRGASPLSIQSDPQYLAATKRFEAKDFAGALTTTSVAKTKKVEINDVFH